jgi:surfeit locus 1 family protein
VAVLVTTFVVLGFWQLRRLEERRLTNMVVAARLGADVEELEVLLGAVGEDFESLRYRPVSVTGEYQPQAEVLVRSQVHRGVAGYHVITPLEYSPGAAVLINRGWVPLEMDQVPLAAAPPPAGEATVVGMALPTQPRPPLGPAEPEGEVLTVVARVDISRLAQQMPWELAPIYLIDTAREAELPIPPSPPDFSDEGPHLAYAVQWFSFAVIGLVGYVLLVGRARRSRS